MIYDEERSKALAGAGIRVVRFWNNDVLKNTENVLEIIYNELASFNG
jgi:very-short-patch-repair endonuclease